MTGDRLERLFAEGDAADCDRRSTWKTLGAAFVNDPVLPEFEPWRGQIEAAIKKGACRCESPIESDIFPWLVAQEYPCFKYSPAVLFPGESESLIPRSVAIIPQLPIGRYRVDFALAASRGGPIRFVIVECDGAEFHDGVTNVVRDVDRDVQILANPRVLDIVRISGRQIHRSPRDAAQLAAKALVTAWAVTNRALDAKFGGTR